MAKFGDFTYNNPVSMYVDPKIEVYQKAAETLQGRHDLVASQYDSLAEFAELAKSQVHTSAADQAKYNELMTATRLANEEAAKRGDFANLPREVRKTGREFIAGFTPLKETAAKVAEYQKLRDEMAASGKPMIDFTEDINNFSTYGENNTINKFDYDVEQRLDRDTKMKSIYALEKDKTPINLSPSQIDQYFQHGQVAGISNDKIEGYLNNAYRRYNGTGEYTQHKKELMKKFGLNEEQAETRIRKDLLAVGMAQQSSEVTKDYLADAERIARARRRGEGDPTPPSVSPFVRDVLLPVETTVPQQLLEKTLPKGSIPNTFETPLDGVVIDYTKLANSNPKAQKEIDLYRAYRDNDGTKATIMTANLAAIEKSLETGFNWYPDVDGRLVKTTTRIGLNGGKKHPLYGSSEQELRQRAGEYRRKLEAIKEIEDAAKEAKVDLKDNSRMHSLTNAPEVIMGKLLNMGGTGNMKIPTDRVNKRNVDGEARLEGEIVFTADELSERMKQMGFANESDLTGSPIPSRWTGTATKALSGDEWQEMFLRSSGGNGMLKEAGFTTNDKGEQVPLYAVNASVKLPATTAMQASYDKEQMPEKMFAEQREFHRSNIEATQLAPVAISLASRKSPAIRQEVATIVDNATKAGDLQTITRLTDYLRTKSEAELKTIFGIQ